MVDFKYLLRIILSMKLKRLLVLMVVFFSVSTNFVFAQSNPINDLQTTVQSTFDQLLNTAKSRFSKELEIFDNLINTLNTKINSAVGLSVENKSLIQNLVSQYSEKVSSLLDQIKSTSTQVDFIKFATDFQNLWNEYKDVHKKVLGIIISGRFESHIIKIEEVVDILQTKLTSLKEQGVDTETTQGLLDQINDKITVIKTDVANVKTYIESLNSVTQTFEQGLAKYNQIKGEIYNLGLNLQSLVTEINNLIK